MRTQAAILVLVLVIIIYYMSSTCAASEDIAPVSTSVMLGEEAKFSCSGEAFAVVWTINGIGIGLLGIHSSEQVVDGVVTSTLTVIGSAQYDNAAIQCVLLVSPTTTLHLPPAFLTVLGIGQVPSVKLVDPMDDSSLSNRVRRSFSFNPAHNPLLFIQWEKPMFVSTDVTDLMYNVSVSGADRSPFHVTANETECCRDMLFACQMYNITVTPFSTSSNYTGASNGTEDIINGGMYRLNGSCVLSEVEFMGIDNVTCSFVCKVEVPLTPCPAQCLQMLTTADNNEHINETSIVYLGTPKSSVVINVTGLHAGEHYHSNFSIIDHKAGVVDKGEESVSFSTYRVRNATFSYLPSDNIVNVTCFFAINAFASACMARFGTASLGLAFNGTVDHSHSSLNSSGNVTIPPEVFQQGKSRVTFDAQVFDVDDNGNIIEHPAFEKIGALEVVLNDAEPNSDTSTHATGAPTSTVPSGSPTGNAIITSVAALSVLIVLTVLVSMTVLLCFWAKKKRCSVKLKNPARPGLRIDVITDEDSQGAEECGPDAVHANLVGGEETTHPTQTPSHTYSPVKRLGPKPTDTYEEVHLQATNAQSSLLELDGEKVEPLPSNIQSSPLELDGEKVEHVESKKDGVMYAELGSRPANAPPVLPPDTSVHYMTVMGRPTPKDTGSCEAEGSGPDADHARFVGGEEVLHSKQSAPKSCSPNPTVKQPRPNPRDAQYEKVDSNPSNAPSSPQAKKDGVVVYAELGSRPADAPPVLPPDVGVNYVDVKPTPKAKISLNLDEKKAEHVESKKDGVVYAELGSRPTNAPPVLPPDTSVHYMTVNQRPAPKNTNSSRGAEESGPDSANLITFSDGESPHSLQSPASSFTYSPEKKQLKPNTGNFQYETVHPQPSIAQSSPHQLGGRKAEHVQSKKGGVVYAELGSRPANAPVVLPPDTSVHYTSVRKEPMLKDTSVHGSSTSVDMRATVSASNTSLGSVIAGVSPPRVHKQSHEKEGKSMTVPFLVAEQSLETEGESHAPQPWEEQPEMAVTFHGKDACITTVMPEFGQHLASLAVRGEPSGLSAAGASVQTLSLMDFTADHVPEESEDTPICLISPSFAYMSKAAVEEFCSETDENADPYLTVPVQENGWEQPCELVMVEGEHYQEEALLEKPCLDERKMSWKLTERSVLSFERHQNSSSFACALGDQNPCLCIPQEESSPDEYKVTQKLTERTVLSYPRHQNSTFFAFLLGNQDLGIPQEESLPEKPRQDEYKMTQKLTEKSSPRKRHRKSLFFACTLGSRNPSIPQKESLSEKPCQDEYKMTRKLTGKSFLRNRHQKPSFFGCTFGNQNPSIPQKEFLSEKPCKDEYKMEHKLTEEIILSYEKPQNSSFFACALGNRNLFIPSSVLSLFFYCTP